MEPDFARTNYIGNRKQSQHQENDRQNSMLDWAKKGDTNDRNKSVLKDSGKTAIDIRGYRGNLYKQTLSPNWSKTKLREAQKKYSQIAEDIHSSLDSPFTRQPFQKTGNKFGSIDANMRTSFMDTRIGGTGGNSPRYGNATVKEPARLFTKTVTNFAQVRFDNNGGLNPVSPVARGLTLESTSTKATNPGDWRRGASTIRAARPTNELDISERAVSVFQPKKIISDVQQSKRMFKKYSAFREEFDPTSSKADYKHFLDKVVQDVRHYDSNISNSLNHQKKFLAYKNRELSQRAAALHGNAQQDGVHK